MRAPGSSAAQSLRPAPRAPSGPRGTLHHDDAPFAMRDEENSLQRRKLVLMIELLAAVVVLGELARDLDEDRGLASRRTCAERRDAALPALSGTNAPVLCVRGTSCMRHKRELAARDDAALEVAVVGALCGTLGTEAHHHAHRQRALPRCVSRGNHHVADFAIRKPRLGAFGQRAAHGNRATGQRATPAPVA